VKWKPRKTGNEYSNKIMKERLVSVRARNLPIPGTLGQEHS
jgi:hypothetical protein